MHTTTTIRSWRAMTVAVLFMLGTGYVLFQDVIKGAPITPAHVLTMMAMIAAVVAGHSWIASIRDGRYMLGFGLAVVAVVATGYIVTVSAARNTETTAVKAAAIKDANERRPGIQNLKAEAEFLLSPCPKGSARDLTGVKCGLREARDLECASGKGKRCDGRQYSVTTYEAAIESYDRQLAKLGPAATPNADYRAAAEVWVAMRGGNIDAVEHAVTMIFPWIAVVISEIGVVMFTSMALGHERRPRTIDRPASDRWQSSDFPALDAEAAANVIRFVRPDDRDQPSGGSSDPDDPDRPSPKGPDDRRDQVLARLLTDLALGRSAGTQNELAHRYGVPRSTMSDWLREWEAAGLIPARRTIGRRKELARA